MKQGQGFDPEREAAASTRAQLYGQVAGAVASLGWRVLIEEDGVFRQQRDKGWVRVAAPGVPGSIRLCDGEESAGPELSDPRDAWRWTIGWIKGGVQRDDGNDLIETPADLVGLPVRCPGCGHAYGATLYAVVRLSEKRPALRDVAVYVDSSAFGMDLFWRLSGVIRKSEGQLGEVIEGWRDPEKFRAEGHRRWPHCARCGAPAPDFKLSKRDAVRAPARPWRFTVDARSFSGWKFPRWRLGVDPPVKQDRMAEAAWRAFAHEVAARACLSG